MVQQKLLHTMTLTNKIRLLVNQLQIQMRQQIRLLYKNPMMTLSHHNHPLQIKMTKTAIPLLMPTRIKTRRPKMRIKIVQLKMISWLKTKKKMPVNLQLIMTTMRLYLQKFKSLQLKLKRWKNKHLYSMLHRHHISWLKKIKKGTREQTYKFNKRRISIDKLLLFQIYP